MARSPYHRALRAKAALNGVGTTYSPTFTSEDYVGNKFTAVLDCDAGGVGTLDVKAQLSYDGGTTFVDVPSGAFTQVGASASVQIKVYDNVGCQFRFAYVHAGAGAAHTFGLFLVGMGGEA